jgi:cytochrome P450
MPVIVVPGRSAPILATYHNRDITLSDWSVTGNPPHLLQRETVTPPRELAADKIADPYPYYAWLRDHAPAYREVTSRGTVVWQVTRYDDVRDLLADDRLAKRSVSTAQNAGPAGLQRNLVHSDSPDHTRLRRLVNRAFVPAQVAALRPLIEETAHELAAQLTDGQDGQGGQADLIAGFAAPLAFGMIRTVLGVPQSPGRARAARHAAGKPRQQAREPAGPGDTAAPVPGEPGRRETAGSRWRGRRSA